LSSAIIGDRFEKELTLKNQDISNGTGNERTMTGTTCDLDKR